MEEKEFHRLADATLDAILDSLESFDDSGALEVELQQHILTVILPGGRQLILNKHTPTRQLWLSSPRSGGMHFSYDSTTKAWALADGRRLGEVLSAELDNMAGIKVQC